MLDELILERLLRLQKILFQLFACGCHGEFAVLDPFSTDQPVGDVFNLAALPSDDKNLQTVVSVKMDVKRRNDLMKRLMLHVVQRVVKFASMMIVHYRDCPYGIPVLRFPFFLDQLVPNHVPDGLGTGSIAFSLDEGIESFD